MIFEDEHAFRQRAALDRFAPGRFRLRDRLVSRGPAARHYARRVREIVRYELVRSIATSTSPPRWIDYRAVYRAYLHDPDLQDARAYFPFIHMWDNHEFSWQGWQALQVFDGKTRPAQTRKVAAMQAFFEYQPARMVKMRWSLVRKVSTRLILRMPRSLVFDEHGLGQEANNLAAINSMKGYRSLRWGRNVELIITDERSYRSEDPEETQWFADAEISLIRTMRSSCPRRCLRYSMAAGITTEANLPRDYPFRGQASFRTCVRRIPRGQTILGAEQKAWFLERLRNSKAPWKIWGSTTATLDMRADPLNIPAGMVASAWPGAGYANFSRRRREPCLYRAR